MTTQTRNRNRRKPAGSTVTPTRALNVIRNSAEKALEVSVQAAQGVRQSAVGAFDALVKQGAALEARGRKAVVTRAAKARDVACDRAQLAKARTTEAVSHLEKVFEQRVSRAISKLGVPTARDVRALSKQVAQLQVSVQQLHRTRARAAR